MSKTDSVRSAEAFGRFTAEKRRAMGYSQFQLGKLVGVTDKAVSKWENGEAYPRLGHCLRLAEKLGVSLDELLKLWNAPERDDARRAG